MDWYHWIITGVGSIATALVTVMLPGWLKFRQGLTAQKKQESDNAIEEVQKLFALQAQQFEKSIKLQGEKIDEMSKDLASYKQELSVTRKELREINEAYNTSLREIAKRDVEIIGLKAEIFTLTNRLNTMDAKHGE